MSVRRHALPDRLSPRRIAGQDERRLRHPLVGVMGGALPVALLVALLAQPALSTSVHPVDWYEHLWYVWHQSGSIRAIGIPSFFVYNVDAVYNPHYAFYGGTLYVSAAVLGLVLGSTSAAFDTFWIAALLMAYGGWYALAPMAGLGRGD